MPKNPPANPRKSREEKIAGYLRPRTMPGSSVLTKLNPHDPTDPARTYKSRFSRVFAPAGHDFIKAWKVVYSSYFLKHGLLTYDDVNLYNLLTYFAETNRSFIVRALCRMTGRTDKTIIASLDRLENCFLIHRLCITDLHGQPYWIVLQTPMFEDKDALTESVKNRLRKAGEPMPTRFLFDQLDTIRKRIEKNTARDSIKNPHKYPDADDRRVQWRALTKQFGDLESAMMFDDLVADVTAQFRNREMSLDTFDQLVAHALKLRGQKYTTKLRELAHQQRAFYERFNPTFDHNAAPAAAPPTAPAATGEPCPVCFGSKMEVVKGKGARPCPACKPARNRKA